MESGVRNGIGTSTTEGELADVCVERAIRYCGYCSTDPENIGNPVGDCPATKSKWSAWSEDD